MSEKIIVTRAEELFLQSCGSSARKLANSALYEVCTEASSKNICAAGAKCEMKLNTVSYSDRETPTPEFEPNCFAPCKDRVQALEALIVHKLAIAKTIRQEATSKVADLTEI
jgi:hypothetical protein